MKKLIALLLALVMVFGLVACGNSNNDTDETKDSSVSDKTNDSTDDKTDDSGDDTTEAGLYDEHVTLKYIFADAKGAADYSGWDDIVAAVNAITEEKINATIEFEVIPLGEFTDKMNMKYMAGEEFDVVFTGAWNNYASAVGKGAYAELTWDMLETYAPNCVADTNEAAWSAVTVDGKIYGVPLQQIWVRQNAIRFNADLADSYNFDYNSVTSLEDVEPYFETLKSAGVTKIFHTGGTVIMDNFSSYLGYDCLVSYTFPGVVYYADEYPTVVNQYSTEEFAELAKIMKKWYDAGYIDADQIVEGATDGSDYAVDTNPALKPGGDVTESQNRGYNVVSIALGDAALSGSSILATNLAVGATSQNPERALAFINLLNSDAELLNLLCNGIEGVDWNWVDKENNVIEKTDSGYEGAYSFLVGTVFNEYYTDASQAGTWEETQTINVTAPASCLLGFTFDSSSVETEVANIQAIITEKLPAISCGMVDDVDAAIADLNAALEAAGLSTVLAEMQAQIDAWKGN